jgi:magnesium chelatase family protein
VPLVLVQSSADPRDVVLAPLSQRTPAMQATALTLGLVGLDAHLVHVEVDSGRGPSAFHLVGLAEAAVREARVRVRAALKQLEIELDEHVITVSMSPADVRKTGSAFDVALAVGVLGALGRIEPEAIAGTVLLGELGLAGQLRPVRGVLPALATAKRLGVLRAIVPLENEAEASAVSGMEVTVASSLEDVALALRGEKDLPKASRGGPRIHTASPSNVDLCEIRGQHGARRALEIAAAGGHNLLMMGPPGAGKTMLARRLPTILPPMTQEEALEVTAIHSVSGLLPAGVGLLAERPFRAPHHTVSVAGLVGGGAPVRPGEVSLAHQGCLFLDELLEFGRATVEALRQPLEDGIVSVCRARERAIFPARPLFVAALNPCPCGHAGTLRCTCAPERVRAYRQRLSGPLLDRIDLQIALPPVDVGELSSRKQGGETSAKVRERVERARAVQLARVSSGEAASSSNATLGAKDLARICALDEAGEQIIRSAANALGLSARAFGKVLRVARTLADLEGVTGIGAPHVAEALHFRLLDRAAPAPAPRASVTDGT